MATTPRYEAGQVQANAPSVGSTISPNVLDGIERARQQKAEAVEKGVTDITDKFKKAAVVSETLEKSAYLDEQTDRINREAAMQPYGEREEWRKNEMETVRQEIFGNIRYNESRLKLYESYLSANSTGRTKIGDIEQKETITRAKTAMKTKEDTYFNSRHLMLPSEREANVNELITEAGNMVETGMLSEPTYQLYIQGLKGRESKADVQEGMVYGPRETYDMLQKDGFKDLDGEDRASFLVKGKAEAEKADINEFNDVLIDNVDEAEKLLNSGKLKYLDGTSEKALRASIKTARKEGRSDAMTRTGYRLDDVIEARKKGIILKDEDSILGGGRQYIGLKPEFDEKYKKAVAAISNSGFSTALNGANGDQLHQVVSGYQQQAKKGTLSYDDIARKEAAEKALADWNDATRRDDKLGLAVANGIIPEPVLKEDGTYADPQEHATNIEIARRQYGNDVGWRTQSNIQQDMAVFKSGTVQEQEQRLLTIVDSTPRSELPWVLRQYARSDDPNLKGIAALGTYYASPDPTQRALAAEAFRGKAFLEKNPQLIKDRNEMLAKFKDKIRDLKVFEHDYTGQMIDGTAQVAFGVYVNRLRGTSDDYDGGAVDSIIKETMGFKGSTPKINGATVIPFEPNMDVKTLRTIWLNQPQEVIQNVAPEGVYEQMGSQKRLLSHDELIATAHPVYVGPGKYLIQMQAGHYAVDIRGNKVLWNYDANRTKLRAGATSPTPQGGGGF